MTDRFTLQIYKVETYLENMFAFQQHKQVKKVVAINDYFCDS